MEPDSAAAKAGVKVGDVIMKFNGDAIVDAGQLAQRVGVVAPGAKVSLEIWRNGKPIDLTATVGNAATVASADEASGDAAPARLGLALRPLTQEERRQAIVVGMLRAVPRAGIQPGDVVLSVDGSGRKRYFSSW